MNKKQMKWSIVAVGLSVMMMVSSCSENGPVVSLLPCSPDSTGAAFVNARGEVIPYGVKAGMPSAVVNGFFTAPDGTGITVYKYGDNESEPVNGLTGLKSAGYMAYGVLPVCRPGGHIEIVNGKGETVAPLVIENGEITECQPAFTDGVLVVTTDKGLHGLVDTHGRVVVEPVYASVGPIRDGRFMAMTELANGHEINRRYSIVSTDGTTLYDFPEGIVPVSLNMYDGKTVVKTTDGFRVCDVDAGGTLTGLSAKIREITDYVDGKIVYRVAGGRSGLIDANGHDVLAPEFRRIRVGAHGNIAVCDDSGWAIIDMNGNRKEMSGFTMLSPVPEQAVGAGFAFIGQTPEGYYVIDAKGEKMNDVPLIQIDYSGLASSFRITSGYPSSVTPMELPLDDGLEM